MAADASSGGMTGMLHPSLRHLLRAVQDARVYPDSKAAVDLVLRRDPEELARLAARAGLVAPEGGDSAATPPPSSVSREALAAFLEEHCDPPGSDLEPHTPEDWRPDPPQLRRLGARPEVEAAAVAAVATAAGPLPPLLTDAERAAVHELARTAVHGRWRVLCRRWKGADGAGGGDGEDAAARRRLLAARSSLLPLPEPQMVPGDRFREAYYWDSYWVVRGLLASGMLDTAAATVRNLVAMADATAEAAAASGGGADGGASSSSLPGGHVPNGARCYYLNRSQPPLLAPMARAVAEALLTSGGEEEGDKAADALLRRCLPAIERELAHWRSHPKQVICVAADAPKEEDQEGATPSVHHALARFWAQWEDARPESQREDEATAAEALAMATAPNTADSTQLDRLRRRLMRDLASAAESGWDFSTRWMPPPPASAGGMRAWEAEEARATTTTTTTTDGGSSNTTASPPPTRPSLAQLRTTRVVPADLNAFLYRAERDAAWAARRLGEQERAARLEALARQREKAMRAVLWDERAACWRDGWMVRRRRRAGAGEEDQAAGGGDGSFPPLEEEEEEEDDQGDEQQQPWIVHRSPGVYASNYIPLWCGLLDDDDDDDDREEDEAAPASSAATADRAALSLLASGLLQPGGVAASLYASGQQWDWPNAWPPLQHALAEACAAAQGGEKRRRSPRARAVGLGVAAAYARAVLQGWGGGGSDGGGELHEKYDARGGGREGAGGEYAPQVGFGWTNGALLALLAAGLV